MCIYNESITIPFRWKNLMLLFFSLRKQLLFLLFDYTSYILSDDRKE